MQLLLNLEEYMKNGYYLNNECVILHKIDENESLIRLTMAEYCEDDYDHGGYVEPVDKTIIVRNEYLSNKKLDVENKIEEYKKQVAIEKRNAQDEKNKIVREKYNELQEIENKKRDLVKKYKVVAGIEKALDMMFGDYEYVVVLDNRIDIVKKDELHTNDREKDLVAFQFRTNGGWNRSSNKPIGITCKVGQYDCYSGRYKDVICAKSIEEAKEILKEYINKQEK